MEIEITYISKISHIHKQHLPVLDSLFLQRSEENQCSLRPLGSEERAPLSSGSKQFVEWAGKPATLSHLPRFPQFVGQVHQRIGKAGQDQILKIQQENVYVFTF